ncbi:tRNA pseudouridine synthase, putative [Plasmodium berghei]|uniref:tRNA pseudouridine(55) synthase n=2 Tax=Plasmodium berghei TaxID=5821 RepID=A0A509ADS1_PLABA|nr:tRNA pseudouridine synthase, putative [Plasmodium berghei ANKA]CXI06958.1 tRNA pseudouridine synthase, putative [Plasmodium berghei]SCL92539.1 tRNA pseudouridine synthase, putative [Plasmodium berghei]SCM15658.1 tRNA pseudouridine synthase, putative [Plasmodium berghei]SCM17452.1 tRNA pseudouridine synthase, putative [Plasmodium berghei]SCN22796.1 tRNA pseudouridine synthase, putative [Plasmodium berghei]|eukprot:XP_034420263.1 tRNA pseudouridine synthase, putative [Plasmodium berghei ANKA]
MLVNICMCNNKKNKNIFYLNPNKNHKKSINNINKYSKSHIDKHDHILRYYFPYPHYDGHCNNKRNIKCDNLFNSKKIKNGCIGDCRNSKIYYDWRITKIKDISKNKKIKNVNPHLDSFKDKDKNVTEKIEKNNLKHKQILENIQNNLNTNVEKQKTENIKSNKLDVDLKSETNTSNNNISKNEVDIYITKYEKKILNNNSRIMNLTPSVVQNNTKKEATIDDILYGGFLNIYKPVKLYSMKVCEKIKKILKNYFININKNNIKIKVGHGGTLDPFAEGVLMIGIQRGTNELSNFLKCYKQYLAVSVLGIETDTLDREGRIIKMKDMKGIKKGDDSITELLQSDKEYAENLKSELSKSINKFIGWIDQIPPIYSSKRVKGLRLYEYARKNIPVKIKSNKVHLKNIKYLKELELPFFDLHIHCSGGTYIRSLIRDIAHSINQYATLIKLIRIKQKEHSYKNSLHYDDINIENIKKYFIKL